MNGDQRLGTLARNWWMVLLRGILAILFGILSFVWPGISLTALVALFAAFATVDGIFAIVSAFRAADRKREWWPFVLEGIGGIGLGVVTFLWPEVTVFALLYLIAAWAAVTGVFEIAAAFRLRNVLTGEWIMYVTGIASIAFAVLVVLFPGGGALAIVWAIAAYAVVFGALLIGLSLRLRRWGTRAETRPAPA